MNTGIEFQIGDRVVANTSSFGRVTGTIIDIVLGSYLHIRCDADNRVIGVHADACHSHNEDQQRSQNK
jgi:hypothetical protein